MLAGKIGTEKEKMALQIKIEKLRRKEMEEEFKERENYENPYLDSY